MYKSPIELIYQGIEYEIEKGILKAVHKQNITVDKEELIRALKYDRDQYEKGYADAKPKWIPVSERLPETDGQYLCNYHFGNHSDMTFTRVLDYYATDAVPHFQHTLGDTTMKVTHWMPLPEPPKGE